MSEQNSRLNVSVEGDVTVVELTERKILDEVDIKQIGDQLNTLVVESQKPKMLLDFTGVSHMSSSALGMLITLHKRICEKSGQLRLCNIQPSIYEVFLITRLNEIFHICRSHQEALDSLGRPNS